MTRSAVVVLVPEAEQRVSELRRRHDPMANRGVPAHVTVLHPFRARVSGDDLALLAEVASQFEPFVTTFDKVATFPGGVVYLSPTEHERFAAMTRGVCSAFPDCPPYGGAFDDPVPHLTIGSRLAIEDVDAVAVAATEAVPFTASVERLTVLLEDDDGMWTVGPSLSLRTV